MLVWNFHFSVNIHFRSESCQEAHIFSSWCVGETRNWCTTKNKCWNTKKRKPVKAVGAKWRPLALLLEVRIFWEISGWLVEVWAGLFPEFALQQKRQGKVWCVWCIFSFSTGILQRTPDQTPLKMQHLCFSLFFFHPSWNLWISISSYSSSCCHPTLPHRMQQWLKHLKSAFIFQPADAKQKQSWLTFSHGTHRDQNILSWIAAQFQAASLKQSVFLLM